MDSFIDTKNHIVLIGAGTIGLSFAALHLRHLGNGSQLSIHDTRPELAQYIQASLPNFVDAKYHDLISQIKVSTSDTTLFDALAKATIVQEQGPENVAFKRMIWRKIEQAASPNALFWSSTSGIAASIQAQDMQDKTRLLVVHPFNPPHIMPLLELVPTPETKSDYVERTLQFWRKRDRNPIVMRKETIGFVANRLAYALLRESIHMVNEGVVTMEELDNVVTSSMGPRWSIAGPFRSYHAGGGAGGLRGFLKNIGGTVQECWNDAGKENFGEGDWEERISRQAELSYGVINVEERDRLTRAVLHVVSDGKMETAPYATSST